MNENYNKDKNGNVYGVFTPTPIARVAWLSLVTPQTRTPTATIPNPVAKYQVTFIFPKEDEKVKSMIAVLKKMTDDMIVIFNKNRPAQLGACSLMKDGDGFDQEKYPYYKNAWVMQTSNRTKIVVKDAKTNIIDAGTVQGGMLCRGVVVPMITAAGGITYRLEELQLAKDDGVRFGNGRPTAGTFLDAIAGDAPDEGLGVIADKAIGTPQVTVQTVMPDGKKKALDLL